MKKTIYIILFISLFVVINSNAQTANEIIDKSLKAQGYDKINSVKTMIASGKMTTAGNTMFFNIKYKQPNKIRSEMTFKGQKMTQTFDGKSGWYLEPNNSKPKTLPNDMLQQLKGQVNMLENPLAELKKNGSDVKMNGKKKIDGKDAIDLLVKAKSGETIHIYIDAKTYIIFRTDMEATINNQKTKISNYYKNYKTINGITIPFIIESKVNGNIMNTMSFDNILFNKNIEDKLFKKP